MSVFDEGYSRKVLDEGYSKNKHGVLVTVPRAKPTKVSCISPGDE
jgi:hypothetical protein